MSTQPKRTKQPTPHRTTMRIPFENLQQAQEHLDAAGDAFGTYGEPWWRQMAYHLASRVANIQAAIVEDQRHTNE